MSTGRGLAAALALAVAAFPAAVHAKGDAPPVWSASPSVRVVSEEKSFQSDGATLSGTLHLPAASAPVAAIVVAHGASSPLRTSPLYRHLIEMLPPLGVAVFTYDRRGSGASGGAPGSGDYALLADDAIAAARLLKSDRRIDPKKVGVWGLSQGGWLSLLAASRSAEIAFAVSISAPLVTPDVQMIFFSENTLRVNGYPQSEIDQMVAMRKAVDGYMRGTNTQADAQAKVDAAKGKPWFKYLYMGETVRDRAVSGWRKEIEHDPLAALAGVNVPALVIYGAVDPVVPVALSVERLRAVAPRHPKMTLSVIAGADHSMQIGVDPKVALDPAQSDAGAPDAPAYLALLASWLTSNGYARPVSPVR